MISEQRGSDDSEYPCIQDGGEENSWYKFWRGTTAAGGNALVYQEYEDAIHGTIDVLNHDIIPTHYSDEIYFKKIINKAP